MKQLVVTGAAGFIACNLIRRLNALGFNNLILVDHFDDELKNKNLEGVSFTEKIDRDLFIEWLTENSEEVSFIFHLGARTDTGEFNFRILDSLNLSYSKSLWEVCTIKQIPLLYASSAATYGLGEQGFSDAHTNIANLKPLNPYGLSKQLFDLYVLEQNTAPPFWCGLKFFNVYGPYEFHKKRMASVVYHAYNQIKQTGQVKLFKSHRPDFKDGEQLRDFIYVDDVVNVCLFFYHQYRERSDLNGIYNLGTGQARSFNDLARAIFHTLQLPEHIEYVPTPEDIRDKYQYFTEAEMNKLHTAGYSQNFTNLEQGVEKYIHFLNIS
ncbi:MAG: ADP-glyceromanno-heptose 6-epimerase [Chitinophagales bacterium]